MSTRGHHLLLVGSYTIGAHTHGRGRGIYLFELNNDTGQLTSRSSIDIVNPSYIVVVDRCHIYTLLETKDERNGIAQIAINDLNQLEIIDIKSIDDASESCHMSWTIDSDLLLVANYHSGNVHAIDRPKLAVRSSYQLASVDSGHVADRQDSAHAHCIVHSDVSRIVYVADLGSDRIYQLVFNNQNALESAPIPWVQLAAGSGPRHLLIHPTNAHLLAVVCELSSTLQMFHIVCDTITTDNNWTLKPASPALSTLESDHDPTLGDQTAAHLAYSNDGRFVYVSNRGVHNSIAAFSVDDRSGALQSIGEYSTTGICPRYFLLVDRWLIVANQQSDSIVVLARDAVSGRLTDPDSGRLYYDCPSPVALAIVAI